MKIAIIDGQGGGIGKHITEKLKRAIPDEVELIALGTNALATAAMLKAGANEGATGENAIVYTAKRADIIVGAISILVANSMLGEVSPKIAIAIGESRSKKFLLPVNRSGISVVGITNEPLPHQIDALVAAVVSYLAQNEVL